MLPSVRPHLVLFGIRPPACAGLVQLKAGRALKAVLGLFNGYTLIFIAENLPLWNEVLRE